MLEGRRRGATSSRWADLDGTGTCRNTAFTRRTHTRFRSSRRTGSTRHASRRCAFGPLMRERSATAARSRSATRWSLTVRCAGSPRTYRTGGVTACAADARRRVAHVQGWWMDLARESCPSAP